MAENKDSLTDTQRSRNFVNTPMDDELKEMLHEMALEEAGGNPDGINYAALIRKLVFQEHQRRQQVKKVVEKLAKNGIHLPRTKKA